MRPLLELIQEPLVNVGHKCEATIGVGAHELANHGLVVVLRDEPAHHEVVSLGGEAMFLEPARELRVVVGEGAPARLRAIRDERRGNVPVLLVDILLDVF